MSVGNNIKIFRKRAGLTQTLLAKKLNIALATLRRWESGETSPTGVKLIALANALKVAPEDFIAGDINALHDTKITLPEQTGEKLIYEGEVNGKNCKIEIPPTPEGYKLFRELLNNIFPVKDWTQDQNLNLN